MTFKRIRIFTMLVLLAIFAPAGILFGQADQGTITGVVQDPSGAVVGNASVTLTNVDQGQILKSKSDGSGIYVFSPIKIGNYKITAAAPGFKATTQTDLHLSMQQRLNVVVTLTPGAVTETVTVTDEAPLMQTQESSVGQTMDTETIDSVPLNGRNWVYIAQLAAGVSPPSGSRGAGKGDFNANGQRAEENNFILDGVDNNANVVDFFNGASYVVNPPPEALAEFKVQTSSYSAEFGHSAGAVISASIKSGSNNFHGSAWEYVRNTVFDAYSWNDNHIKPNYHDNVFGATLGGPVWRNKLFLFADAQANRIAFNPKQTFSVPTANERMGDFSELLNPDLLGSKQTIQLYKQSADGTPVAITNNCLVAGSPNCPTAGVEGLTLNKTALNVLSLYPEANVNGGKLYNNRSSALPIRDNTFQWDVRADWTIGPKDTTYSRFSYYNEVGKNSSVLGDTLDGGGSSSGSGDGKTKNLGDNYMWSETHVFTQTMTNEARFGFNYLHTGYQHPHANDDGYALSMGFGGIPTGSLNGGLPNVSFSGTSSPQGFGSPTWAATDEHNNVYQIIDNLTKIAGNHALKAGVSYQNIRFSTFQPQEPRGYYNYTGASTSLPGTSNTGYGVADFLLDQQNNAGLSNAVTDRDQRANFAAYFQDDWRYNSKLTFNLGIRWEYFQPYKEIGGNQASFYFTSKPTFDATTGKGKVTGKYLIPTQTQASASATIAANGFDTSLKNNGMDIVYDSNPRLQTSQNKNFAPRVGVAWSPNDKTVVRAGFGIFFGGLESLGYWGNLGENYPFQFSGSFPAGSCTGNYCPTDGLTIANGFTDIISKGFASQVTNLSLRGTDAGAKSPYTEDWNLTFERSFSSDLVASLSYVANTSRHLEINIDPNSAMALENHNNNAQSTHPMPDFSGSAYTGFGGISNYNALQSKLEKRMSKGFNLLATYTWSHAMDDAVTPLGSSGDGNYRSTNLIPFGKDYANASFDVRQRFTFNGMYELPFGKGRAYLNKNAVVDEVVGGWSINAMFTAQTGEHFTVSPSGISAAAGFENGPFAYPVKNQYAKGGTSTSPLGTASNCAASVKNRANWYNPCSFANPWDSAAAVFKDGSNNPHYIPTDATDAAAQAKLGNNTPVYVQDTALVMGYAGGKRDSAVGPGFERVNMSIFKDFNIYRASKLTFRADVFNVFNTPSLGLPSTMNTSASGGNITAPRSIQNNSPDARFIQLSGKISF
jgi:hypothetical protein